ncbi:MAG TPA: bifunctional oligoribonuclease/PAP phosphatase NrnA [Thermoleophilaceae bacterium]|nr:bifunctional oligoribonuclease/PAP phosphatase NrnA [Thermoleophilaceae bacterium]
MSVITELDQVADELRDAGKLLLTTHENPDGDALGSLLGMHLVLCQLDKDAAMFLSADEFPLPHEYRRLPLEGVMNEPPGDLEDRLVVFLDCGNIDRMPVDFLRTGSIRIVNIDHHHDNTRFGEVNLVDPSASCTAELVWRLAHELGAEITEPMAEALYVGLVTDTGRFMYRNTGAEAHLMAAELIEAGASPPEVNRQVFESLPFRRLELLARALTRVDRLRGGAVTVTHLTREDFVDTGSDEHDSEGIVDHLRSVEGTVVAVLVRELLAEDRAGLRKVSLRSADGRVDVSQIARAHGGGGHLQAAGFTTGQPLPELLERLCVEVGEQL